MARWCADIGVERDGLVVKSVPVAGSLMVGRGGDNDLILSDRSVSSRHALFYFTAAGNELRVRDLGSANGTWIGDTRVSPEAALADGARVRLGATVVLRATLRAADVAHAPSERAAFVEDVSAGIRYPITSDVTLLGAGPACQIHLAGGADVEACLTVYDSGEVRLGRDGDESALEVGEVFELAGRPYVLRPGSVGGDSTFQIEPVASEPAVASVALEVDLTRAGGGIARFAALPVPLVREGPAWPVRALAGLPAGVDITSENRVALLYVLARQIRDDRARGVPDVEAGWCSDAVVMQGIWGRQWENQEWNTYQVLLFRLRKELKAGGFDGFLLEKRKGHTRLRVTRVAIVGA